MTFVLASKLYLEMYGKTGIATDSARMGRAASWARWLGKKCFASVPHDAHAGAANARFQRTPRRPALRARKRRGLTIRL